MRNFTTKLVVALASLMLAVSAMASDVTVNLNPDLNQYATYTYTGSDGNQHQEYVAPYAATVTIDGVQQQGFLACFDINKPTYVGQDYAGTLVTPTTTADFEASWLLDQLVGTTWQTDPSYLGPISLAIWQVEFDPATGEMATDPAAQPWVDAAAAAVAGGYVPDKLMFLPDDTSSQRFGVITLNAPVPEPGTLAMFGSGIVGLAGVLRRKFKV